MAISKKVVNDTRSFINNVKALKIDLVYYTFDEDISGVLVLNGSHSTIGVNQGHSEVRKRFTIAHELGHYVLHKDQGSMFMDKVLFRKNSEEYSVRDGKLEKEANYFAANILMPENIVKDYIEKNDIDFYEDLDIQKMAKAFGVSSSAMTYRLINLGVIATT
jgi:Zn-dependent peptidase ImmA (M78 family)